MYHETELNDNNTIVLHVSKSLSNCGTRSKNGGYFPPLVR